MIQRTIYQKIKCCRYEYMVSFLSVALSTMFIYTYMILMDKKFWIEMGFSAAFSILSDKIIFALPFVSAIPIMMIIYLEYFLYSRKKKELAIKILAGFTRRKIALVYCVEKIMIVLAGGFTGILLGGIFAPFILSQMVVYMGEYLPFKPLFSKVTIIRTYEWVISVSVLSFGYFAMRINRDALADMMKSIESNRNSYDKKKSNNVLRIGVLVFGYIGVLVSLILLKYFFSLVIWNKIIGIVCFLISVLAIAFLIKNKMLYSNRIRVMVMGLMDETILCVLYPTLYSMAKANLLNEQILYLLVAGLVAMLFFIIIFAYETLADFIIKRRLCYKKEPDENRIILGDICHNAQIYGRTMGIITIVLIFIICLKVWIPICTNRIAGYLDERSTYDMQLFTTFSYNAYINHEDSGAINFAAVLETLKKQEIEVDDEIEMETFFVNEYMRNGDVRMAIGVPLSDYNRILLSLGHQPILLKEKYALQWSKVYSKVKMDEALEGIEKIETGEMKFTPGGIQNYMYKMGMAFFVGHKDYIYVFQDKYCENVTRATSIALYNFANNINYDENTELEKEISSLYEHSNNKVYVRLKAIQRTETISVIALIRIVEEYIGELLFFGCLTILSVQLLIYILQSEKKHELLYSLGFSEKKIRMLAFRNEMVWFLIPVVCSTIITMGCLAFSLIFFEEEYSFYNTSKQVLFYIKNIYLKMMLFSGIYMLATWIATSKIIHSKIHK